MTRYSNDGNVKYNGTVTDTGSGFLNPRSVAHMTEDQGEDVGRGDDHH